MSRVAAVILSPRTTIGRRSGATTRRRRRAGAAVRRVRAGRFFVAAFAAGRGGAALAVRPAPRFCFPLVTHALSAPRPHLLYKTPAAAFLPPTGGSAGTASRAISPPLGDRMRIAIV